MGPEPATGIPSAPALAVSAPLADTLPSGAFVIRDVRLFDGDSIRAGVDVFVRDGRVERIAAAGGARGDLPVVGGADHTLMPGLIDAHTHSFDPSWLEQALSLGVTLHLDMFTAPPLLGEWRREQAAGEAAGRADVLGPGFLATAGGGHGTQYGLPVPTVDTPEQADAWVADRVAEGADFIKIIVEDGSQHGLERPTLDAERVRAVVAAARRHGLTTVVHVSTVDDALMAAEAGADGLAHLWVDRVPTAEEVRRLADAGLFVIPTLVVLEGMTGRAGGTVLLGDADLAPWLDPSARTGLEQRFPGEPRQRWEVLAESIRALHAAGIPLLTGSDAPNPGTAFGASVHREMELLVEAGLGPVDALRAATANAGGAFSLPERGRIAEGTRADLVLVEGDPTTDITDSRRIVSVWKEGRAFDREAARERVARAIAEAERGAQPVTLDGDSLVVGDFEDGTLAAPLGLGWSESSDGMAGGRSTVSLEVVEGGAGGSGRALRMTGEVAGGAPFAWAGALYMPGAAPFAPVDLSATEGLAFSIRGEAPAFHVAAFSQAGGPIPVTVPVEVTPEWTEVFLPWSRFPGLDPSGVTGISIGAGPAPGPFEVLLDRVVFR